MTDAPCGRSSGGWSSLARSDAGADDLGSSRASLAHTLSSLDSAQQGPPQQGPPSDPDPLGYFCHAVVSTDVMLVDTVKARALCMSAAHHARCHACLVDSRHMGLTDANLSTFL